MLNLKNFSQREKLFKLIIYLFFFVNFENQTIEFHVFYILNMHIKFCLNQILFTINLFFIHNFRLQKLKILTFG